DDMRASLSPSGSIPPKPSSPRASSSTKTSITPTGLYSSIQSSRGKSADCPRSASSTKRFIRYPQIARESRLAAGHEAAMQMIDTSVVSVRQHSSCIRYRPGSAILLGDYLVDKCGTRCSMADKENLSCPPIFNHPHSLTKPQPAKRSKLFFGHMAPYAPVADHLIVSVR